MTIEPERYEQWEGPRYRFDATRREFLRTLGGGLLVMLAMPWSTADASAPGRGRGGRSRDAASERVRGASTDHVEAWIRVGPDDSLTVYTGKVEVGQGIRASLAQIVAEELRLSPDRITMVMGDTALTPYDRGTHGSQSTPRMGSQLRAVAATTGAVLRRLAGERWKADPKELALRDGNIVDPASKRCIGFAQLVADGDLTAVVDAQAPTRPTTDWSIAGESAGSPDARAIVTGTQRFVSDLHLPDLQYGKVLRAPAFGATLEKLDVSKARELPSVTVVHDGDFVGVTAPDLALAEQALAAIEASWTQTKQPGAKEIFEHLERHPIERQGWRGRREQKAGSVPKGLRSARHRLEARFTIPYIAHVPLEPRAALATWVGDQVLVWAGTQHPFPVRDDVAEAFGLSQSQVRVRVPATGSGYGGKHTAETAIEAARLARAAGKPVKVIWSREEEFWWAYFRPAGVMDLRCGVSKSGMLTAWEHVNLNSGGSALECPYRVANKTEVFQPTESPARQGSYRALAGTANCFARESMIDEAAHAAGVDPLEFRRRHLDDERLLAVLDAAADRFGWPPKASGNGRGAGMAIGHDKGGRVATFVEVDVPPGGEITVRRIVTAFDCGAVINPDGLTNQIEGAVIMGLGGALHESIELDHGRVLNPRLSDYRVPRFDDVGQIETVIVDRPDQPSAGAGETPIVGVAPAIANAVFAATGKRLRHLPLNQTLKA